jgi:hypothetical protein
MPDVCGWWSLAAKRVGCRSRLLLAIVCVMSVVATNGANRAFAEAQSVDAIGRRLVAAYPDHLAAIDGRELVWRDGTRMVIDDGKGAKSFEGLLEAPDIKDMFHWSYRAGAAADAPEFQHDPGRARHQPLFDKMYGDCMKGGTTDTLVEVVWLPKKARQRLKVTRVNGVAGRLAAVSRKLDELPAKFDAYLFPAAGTYNCRPIAGTTRPSVHGAGIAIDIGLKHAHYWRWTKPGADGRYPFRNSIPAEIVAAFESEGFIWGGRWYHYDTMHFEYRPELIDPKPDDAKPDIPKPIDNGAVCQGAANKC